MTRYEKLVDLPRRPWDELPEDAQQMYLAAYRRTWEKCHASGVADRDELARIAHQAAVLAVEDEFAADEEGRIVRAPAGEEIGRRKLDPGRPPVED